MNQIQEFCVPLIKNVESVVIGKRSTLDLLLVALLCEGHVLLEDVPGVGKTMMARSLALSFGSTFKRIQCTPDLLPNDITGVSVYNQKSGDFEFKPGPIFTNILLADEINRATPRSQSALLEAMQEHQVTVDGTTYSLPRPFMVIATQNPIEYEGTFPLPEAQLDRFLIKLPIGYLKPAEEKILLTHLGRVHPIEKLEAVAESHDLIELEKLVWDVYVEDSLQEYIVTLAQSTRQHLDLALGVSPRASFALYRCSQAYAGLQGRDHVIPDDIQHLVPYVLGHRLILKPDAELRGKTSFSILEEIIKKIPVPIKEK